MIGAATALDIVGIASRKGTEAGLKPLAIVVLAPDLSVRAAVSQDGATAIRFDIARAKAAGAIQMGVNSRAIEQLAANRPAFFASLTSLPEAHMIAAAGGVLIEDGAGAVIGAVGISGDTSDNDEECAIIAISGAGLKAR